VTLMLVTLTLALAGLALANAQRTAQQSDRGTGDRQRETLRFADDFDEFDLSRWKHEMTMGGGGNWEFQLYHNSRNNSYVRDGVLYLKPTLLSDVIGEGKVLQGHRYDMWGSQPADLCTGNQWWGCERTSTPANMLNPITSARLRTAESFTFKYGRVEVKAKLPRGDWLWPAIWLLPAHNSYGQWPASGEIDICESRGNHLAGGYGVDTVTSTLHWGPNFDTNLFKLTTKSVALQGSTFADGFHTYGLYWDEHQLYTYLDEPGNVILKVDFLDQTFWERGKQSGKPEWAAQQAIYNPWANRTAAAPFDQEFYLIMNLAVGGTMNYFPDAMPGKPWKDKSPSAVRDFWNAKSQWYPSWKGEDAALAIDSVKVWTLPQSRFTYPRGNATAIAHHQSAAAAVNNREGVTFAEGAELQRYQRHSVAEGEREASFLVMSIVALTVSAAAMIVVAITTLYTARQLHTMQTQFAEQQSQPPSHLSLANGAQSPRLIASGSN